MSLKFIDGQIQLNPYTLTQSEFEANKSAQLESVSRIVKSLAALASTLPPPPTDGYSSNGTSKVMARLDEMLSIAQNLSHSMFYPMQPPPPGPIKEEAK